MNRRQVYDAMAEAKQEEANATGELCAYNSNPVAIVLRKQQVAILAQVDLYRKLSQFEPT